MKIKNKIEIEIEVRNGGKYCDLRCPFYKISSLGTDYCGLDRHRNLIIRNEMARRNETCLKKFPMKEVK